MSFALESTKSYTEFFVSAGKGSDKNIVLHPKEEVFEDIIQGVVNPEQPKENQAGTWITTTPLGIQVGTEGGRQMDLEPILLYQATDPADGTVILFFVLLYHCLLSYVIQLPSSVVECILSKHPTDCVITPLLM